ncbi:hypothetical protein NXC14_PA00188 (plasmid) [Rhizobium sp. NXC14]|nr:hypothetical protein NXC14_PA00188 [Rhizobium sp. NXC14]
MPSRSPAMIYLSRSRRGMLFRVLRWLDTRSSWPCFASCSSRLCFEQTRGSNNALVTVIGLKATLKNRARSSTVALTPGKPQYCGRQSDNRNRFRWRHEL